MAMKEMQNFAMAYMHLPTSAPHKHAMFVESKHVTTFKLNVLENLNVSMVVFGILRFCRKSQANEELDREQRDDDRVRLSETQDGKLLRVWETRGAFLGIYFNGGRSKRGSP